MNYFNTYTSDFHIHIHTHTHIYLYTRITLNVNFLVDKIFSDWFLLPMHKIFAQSLGFGWETNICVYIYAKNLWNGPICTDRTLSENFSLRKISLRYFGNEKTWLKCLVHFRNILSLSLSLSIYIYIYTINICAILNTLTTLKQNQVLIRISSCIYSTLLFN